jgi:serine/threonine protein kinase
MSEDNMVRITDFGIARSGGTTDESFTKTGTVMGTWAFMAPEQRVNAKGVDLTADIYGVGATLFSMATRKTPMDLFAADLDPEMLNAVPEPLLTLIRKSTRYNREERYPNAQAMLDAVRLRQSQVDTVSYPIRTAPPPNDLNTGEAGPQHRQQANETFVADNIPNADLDLAASITPPPFRPSSIADTASALTMDEDATILPHDLEAPSFDIANPPKNRDLTVIVLITITILIVGGLVKRVIKTTPDTDGDALGNLSGVPADFQDNQALGTPVEPITESSVEPMPPVKTSPDGGAEEPEVPPIPTPPVKIESEPSAKDAEPESPTATAPTEVKTDPDLEAEPDPAVTAPAKLAHSPAKMARMGSTMFVTAQIKNLSPVELRTYEAIAYFRADGTARWTRSVMTRERSTWSTPIAITADMEGGLEYVIKAKPRDSMGGTLPPLVSGTNKNPHYVRITSP